MAEPTEIGDALKELEMAGITRLDRRIDQARAECERVIEAALAAARAEERAACVAAVTLELLEDPNPNSESDEVYDRAVRDCLAALRERGEAT